MKKVIGCLSAVSLAGLLAGCVAPVGPLGASYGYVYTDVSGPLCATSNSGATKMGQATSTGVVCVATGDSSIKAAMDNGGITKISHVDYHTMSVLGVYVKTTVTVYGQ